ncbi:MAG: hypothetical protein FWF15_02715 [Oscillospiraceae bacterium]|nr:hypothetical protein [Oscillospiraceae bacterium]
MKKNKMNEILTIVLSIVVAFIIWFYIMSVESPSETRTIPAVPIVIQMNENAALGVYSGNNSFFVDVTVQGKRNEINALKNSDISAIADATNITKADRYSLDVIVKVPYGLKHEQSVSSINVVLDISESRVIRIKPVITEAVLEEGYEIGESEISLNNTEMTITGPKAIIDSIDYAVINLKLSKIVSSLTVVGTPEYVDKDGKKVTNPYITPSITTVIADVPIYQFKTVPIEVGYKYGYFTSNNVNISIEPQNIRIKGEVKDIRNIDKIWLTPIDEKKTEGNKLSELINMPEGIFNVDNIAMAEINITYKNTDTKEIVIYTDNFEIINPNDIAFHFTSDSINVRLRGDFQSINYITSSNVKAIVDVTNLSGAASIPVSIEILEPYAKTVYELSDYKISVELGD